VTYKGLRQVADGERYLYELGLHVVRVHYYGNMARLEVAPEEIEWLVALREQVVAYFKTLGFNYVTVDLSVTA
jgi:pyridinium-3,5-biscarboxylic acid mononucleotide sulfurtransferase